jgi:hypothetical protein
MSELDQFVNGTKNNSIYERLRQGEDLSKSHPKETAEWNEYKSKNESSQGTRRLND